MTINDKFTEEKLQFDTNREAAKISESSSGKIDKYEYLTGKYYHLIKDQRQNKLSLHIPHKEKLQENKQK